jgi:hypothetical protein
MATNPPDRIVVPFDFGPSGAFIRLRVGGELRIDAILDTKRPISVISTEIVGRLPSTFFRVNPNDYRLIIVSSIEIEEQPAPELEFRISNGLGRFGIEALLGLNFVFAFRELHFERDTLTLTLVP